MATNHSREITCDLEIACSKDGIILGLRGIVYGDMGAYTRTNGGIVPARAAQFLVGPYRISALQFDVAIFLTNKTPVGTYRGPGRFEANFFRERLMDLAANDLGIDAGRFPADEFDPRARTALLDRQACSVRQAVRLRHRRLSGRLGTCAHRNQLREGFAASTARRSTAGIMASD